VNVLRARGPSFTASAACAGGNYNIATAASWIETGMVDAAIAGGVEVEDPHFFAGFDSMRAYNGQDNDRPDRASRPYARDRAGFIFSEGAGILVLESRDSAEKRGATILGVLRGYGMTSDGTGEMVAPSPEGAEGAMRRALDDAGVSPDEIDYVNTHGTSTPLGDLSEVRAMRRVFGERRLRYSSTKGYTGHPVSAAGAVEAIFTLSMIRGGWVAPSVNAEPLDPELEDYPPVIRPTDAEIRLALSNSFGFGGTNACIVLGKA
jgi:3-oxoacyl-(acyl-carrier-protein) synthase